MSAGRVILIVLGSIGVLLGLALLAGGGFLLWADRTQREDGYLTTPTERFATPTYALTRTRLESRYRRSRLGPERQLVRQGSDPRRECRRRRRSSWASGRRRLLPSTWGLSPTRMSRTSTSIPSESRTFRSREARPKGRRRSSASGRPPPPGSGTQTLTWKVREGDWSVVLMNCRRLAWRRREHRRGRQDVLPALGCDRGAPRRRARHRGKRRIDRPRRADAPATAFATGTSYRGRRIRKCAGSRASRPVNRRGPA